MRIEAYCKQPSKKNSVKMRFHCAGGRTQKKRGFSYFLCCGIGNDEDAAENNTRTIKPQEPSRIPQAQLPSHVTAATSPARKPLNKYVNNLIYFMMSLFEQLPWIIVMECVQTLIFI